MRAFRYGLLWALLSLAASVPAIAQQLLWQNFTTGMTLEEARRAAPNAEAVDNPKAVLSDGAIQRLNIPKIEIVGRSFDANVFFKDNRLTRVHLVHKRDEETSAGRLTYNELLIALRSKYGPELSSKGRNDSIFGFSGDATWAAGPTTIELIAFINKSTFIQIGYSARLANEAGKL